MNSKDTIKCVSLSVGMIALTSMMTVGVYSSLNNSATTNNEVTFKADAYVDADVKIYLNNVLDVNLTFKDTLLNDDEQTATLSNITDNDWKDNILTESEIDKKAEVKFVITNTSKYSNLNVSISREGNSDNCNIINPEMTTYTNIEKDSDVTFTYTFEVDGRVSVETFTNTYSLILESVEK